MSSSEPARLWVSRRALLRGGALALGSLALPLRRARAESQELPRAVREALATSRFVYISPLRSDGSESRCHGEVWFSYDRGDVLIASQSDTWKVRALGKGLARARIWVGDFGVVSRAGERYRAAPRFEAGAEFERSEAAFERLLADFARKYPEGWERWEPRFRKGWREGSRLVIRYRPR